MDWEAIRNIFIQFLNDNMDLLEEDTSRFVEEFIQNIKEKGYTLGSEEERSLTQWAQTQANFVRDLILNTARIVSVAAFGEMRDEFVVRIAKESFERTYPDGLNLSQRLWDWSQELKRGLKDVLAQNIYFGRGVNKIVYELQYEIERQTGEEFKLVLKEKLPEWVEELRESAKLVIKDRKLKELWEEKVKEIEEKIKRLGKSSRLNAKSKRRADR